MSDIEALTERWEHYKRFMVGEGFCINEEAELIAEEAIAALQTPLPEDIQIEIDHLRYKWAADHVDMRKWADMLEKLGRENVELIEDNNRMILHLKPLYEKHGTITVDAMADKITRLKKRCEAFEQCARQELFEDGFEESPDTDRASYMQGRLDFIDEVRERIGEESIE